VAQNPTTKQNQPAPQGTITGVFGKLVDTVSVKGTPASGVAATESNQTTITRNGQPQGAALNQGAAHTNANGQFTDNLYIAKTTNGTKVQNTQIKGDLKNNVWKLTDIQRLTLTFSNGLSCSFTSSRTLTNAAPNGGVAPNYTLTTSQPQ
jgi:hypothetical protein